MALFDNVKKFAKLRGMNLQEVAIKSGLSKNTLYKWRDYKPSDPYILAVAKTLGVTYEELTGTAKETTPTKIDLGAALDDSDDVIMTFDGKPIPDEDKELIKRLLRGK